MFDHFAILAPYYDRVIGPPNPERLRSLLRLPVAGRMLDAGGGTARVSAQLRPYVRELVLADVSPPMLDQARGKTDLHPLLSQAERLPFPDGSFERVLVVDALHHFHNQEAAIADLVRVLSPGGRLVIEEPNLDRLTVKFIAVVEKMALMRSHFYRPEAIRDMVAAHELATDIVHDNNITSWVIADKKA